MEQDRVISTLYRQLETAAPMPRGELAGLRGRHLTARCSRESAGRSGGVDLAPMADARFFLYALEPRPVRDGSGELRAVIDPAEKSQGLFFRPWDDESDLRFLDAGGSRGVGSVNVRGRYDDGAHTMLYLVVNHDPYRGGKAPGLKGRIEYFDEPNATLRIKYDSTDRSVSETPDVPRFVGCVEDSRLCRVYGNAKVDDRRVRPARRAVRPSV